MGDRQAGLIDLDEAASIAIVELPGPGRPPIDRQLREADVHGLGDTRDREGPVLPHPDLLAQRPAQRGLHDERAGHVDARRLHDPDREVADPGPRRDVAVDRTARLRVQGEEAVRAVDLEALPGALAVGLERQRPCHPGGIDRQLPPAPAVASLGDGPGDVTTHRIALVSGDSRRSAHADASAVAPATVAALAAASSSQARARAPRPRTRTSRARYSSSIVPRSRTRASSSPAVYGTFTSTSTQSVASRAES